MQNHANLKGVCLESEAHIKCEDIQSDTAQQRSNKEIKKFIAFACKFGRKLSCKCKFS